MILHMALPIAIAWIAVDTTSKNSISGEKIAMPKSSWQG
jgi:hypothetical protein